MVASGSQGRLGCPTVLAADEREVASACASRGDRALERPFPGVGAERRDERDRGSLEPDARDGGTQVEVALQLLQEPLVDRRGENRIRRERGVPRRERERVPDPHRRVGAERNVLLVEREAVQACRCPHAAARLGHHLRPDPVARRQATE